MIDPLAELVELLRAVGSDGYVVVGGLAVRLLAGERNARETRDVDIVAMSPGARDRILSHLRSRGYQVGATGGWHRAALAGTRRPMIDVATHPVVNPRTFEELTLREEPRIQTYEGVPIPFASANDLALLKLAAHRDQDIVDLLLLAAGLSARAIAQGAQHDDVERTAAEGAQTARLLVASGTLAGLVEELIGRPASDQELAAFDKLLSDLHKEGL